VFRRLNPKEVPPSLGKAYGSEIKSTVFPENNTPNELLSGYKLFDKSLETTPNRPHTSFENKPPSISKTSNVWVFGKNNKLSKKIKTQLNRYEVEVNEQGVTLEGNYFNWENHSFVFVVSHKDSNNEQLVWLITQSKKSIPGLIRKLPHYGKYGYLVFEGDEPKNVVKGIWPSSREGLDYTFTKGTYPLSSKEPLIKK